jgi:DNA polymerase-3 subunit gamma/tau
VANGPGSLDVIEMDAATHGLVDDARELRDKALFAPVQSRYKIYIIDEAHQLGPAAANALLKIVEEPPPYVIFIFATTEPEKVIPTIRSRTHHYQFRLVSNAILFKHLNEVLKAEGVSLPEDVVQLAVTAGAGSVRDSLSILGQLIAGSQQQEVDYETATLLIGQTGNQELSEIFKAVIASQLPILIHQIEAILQRGLDPRRFVVDLLERLRDMTVFLAARSGEVKTLRNYGSEDLVIVSTQAEEVGIEKLIIWSEILAEHLVKLRSNLPAQVILEMMFVRMMKQIQPHQELHPSTSSPQPRLKVATENLVSSNVGEKGPARAPISSPGQEAISGKDPEALKSNKSVLGSLSDIERIWSRVLENVKNRRRLTWTLLSTGVNLTDFHEGKLFISFGNSGALDSFTRSGSEEILLGAFTETFSGVTGFSFSVGGIAHSEKREDESVEESEDVVTGEDLLMKELGATIISKEEI